jgi:hypothetical protein
VLKACVDDLVAPMKFIFNLILRTGAYPTTWKKSRVTPIPKKGSKVKIENYRPIAILSAIAKVFESALQSALLPQCLPHITSAQHAFLPKRSVATNLLTLTRMVSRELDKKSQVDVIYLDFQKAFDRVDNDILLLKLGAMGFTPRLLKLFSSYLSGRKQYVKYGPYVSECYLTRSGVSQGSNLGPLLFVLLINDLSDEVRGSMVLLFADDVKLVKSIQSQGDRVGLQTDIDAVYRWSLRNKLYFNAEKCEMLTFTRSNTADEFQYTIGGVPVARVESVRDLGVLFDPGLTFREHIQAVTKSASGRLGFVLRNSAPLSVHATRVLYAALVRSVLETNAVVWSPHESKYSLMLEQVQKIFLRALYKRIHFYYPYMYPTLFLQGHLGYDSLQLRRLLSLAKFSIDLVRGKIDCVGLVEAFVRLFVPDWYVRARRHPLLAVPGARTRAHAHNPIARALAFLNSVLEAHSQCDLFASSSGRLMIECRKVAECEMPASTIV